MRTTKPIATISFNTPSYLALKLRELQKAGRISFWAFIVHKPEDDEGGKKEHSHVYLEPSKMLQTDDLREALKEFDPTMPEKPRGCLTFVSSKFDAWYMYALHDKRYLAHKGEARRFHYCHDDMVTSDEDDLLYKSRMIDMISLSPYADMEDAQRQGLSFGEYFSRGTIPIQQVALFQTAWNVLSMTRTDRGGRPGHAMAVDPETDEVMEEMTDDPDTDEVMEEMLIDPETGEAIEETPEAYHKRLYGDHLKPKTYDELRIELLNETAEHLRSEGSPPSYYDLHPKADLVSLDPDEGLPW